MPETVAPPTQDTHAVVAQMAEALGETEPQPRWQIPARAVRILGPEHALGFLEQAQESERQGGLLLPDGSRRRTPGGVFFYQLGEGITREERWRVFPKPPQKKGDTGGEGPSPAITYDWFTDDATRQGIVQELQSALGEATTMKLTAIGRPAKIEQRDQTVLVGLRSAKAPSLPKGVLDAGGRDPLHGPDCGKTVGQGGRRDPEPRGCADHRGLPDARSALPQGDHPACHPGHDEAPAGS